MATEDKENTLEYYDGYTDEITDELSEDGGTAVAQVPESEIKYDVDLENNENNIEFEVETEPAPTPEPEPETYEETVTEEVTEEYYDPGYNRGYGYNNRGYGYGNRGYGYNNRGFGYNRRRQAYRKCNKHIFTWIFSFTLGIYGVDRFARGQIGLGLLKLMTFGGFGLWYLADVLVAILESYAGPYRDQEDLEFDQFGRYTY